MVRRIAWGRALVYLLAINMSLALTLLFIGMTMWGYICETRSWIAAIEAGVGFLVFCFCCWQFRREVENWKQDS